MTQTAQEVRDKQAAYVAQVLGIIPDLTEIQAKRMALKFLLVEYQAEKAWLKAFQAKYKELLDKIRYSDSVVEKLRRDYQKNAKRMIQVEGYITFCEDTEYVRHAR